MQSERFSIYKKLLLLFIIIIIIGAPINSLFKFLILLFIFPIIIFSYISYSQKKIYSLGIIIFIILYKIYIPNINIQEGHNVLVLSEHSYKFYENNLPDKIFNFFLKEFKKKISDNNCKINLSSCFRSYKPKDNDSIFSYSNDWSFSEVKYSRIVNDINFTDLTSARIGIINDNFNFYDNSISNKMHRDNLPFFVMYEIPKALIGSSLCWKGDVFWEKINNEFHYYKNTKYNCKKIDQIDLNKKIYIIAVNDEVIVKLEKNSYLKFLDVSKKFFLSIAILILLLLNLKFNYKIYLYSALYLVSYIFLISYVNKQLLYGFDIFPGGMDGLVYMNYSNVIFQNLINFNIFEAFRGAESVFFFPSSLRYFWAINKFIFGESFYGYLLIPFFYTGIIYYILTVLVGRKWSLFITSVNFFTNTFDGYGLPNMKFINHINVGHAEPLAIFLLLSGGGGGGGGCL